MKRLNLCILVSIGWAFCGCDEAVRQPGEAGGECRLGSEPCADGLLCRDGTCQTEIDMEEPEPIDLEFTIADRHIPADGESETVLLIQGKFTDTGDSFEGDLIVYPTPYGAGRMEPGRITFNNGIAQAVYIPCRASDPVGCPRFVRVSAARPDTPREPIASSPSIELFDPAEAFESAVHEMSCASGEGKFALRPNLSIAEEELSEFSASEMSIDAETSILSLSSGGHQIGFRFDASTTQSGAYALDTTDLTVALNPNTAGISSQCADSASGEWSGNLQVGNATMNDMGLQALSFFFEGTCVSDRGQGVSIRACGNYVAEP